MKLAYLKKRSRLRRYTLPIILVVSIFSFIIFYPKDYFWVSNSQVISLLVFSIIVTISSWYGGLGPGIFATGLTASADYFTLLKEDLPYHSATGDLLLTFLYIILGLFISIVSEARYESELQKDEFIGLAAHEIKNPLSVIIGFAGLIQQNSKKIGSQKMVEFANEIKSQSYKLLDLINDLLDVNKIEVGKFVYEWEIFDFDSLVKEIVSHLKIINKKRTLILSGSSKKIIEGDRYRIGQVITNLLTNALKYSPDQSPIEIKMKKNKQSVILSVRDYGIGIPKSEQVQIFNQYYRTRNTLRMRADGLGLGLFICKSIIDIHKGKIWVESDEGKGSTFYMLLPIKKFTSSVT